MITLYHLRDWYGNVKQKRNNKPQSAIQQSVSQEATNAQCGNQGFPQPGASRSQSASRTGNILLTQPAAEGSQHTQHNPPGLVAQFRTATSGEVALLPQLVDPELLEGTTVNFSRSLIRLVWMLQHAETILPAGEIQADLNCHTAGVSDFHAWGLITLQFRVSPITYHSVVAVRFRDWMAMEIRQLCVWRHP